MKKMKLIYYLIIAFVWGYLFTAMVYNGMWSNFLIGLRALKWWIYPLGFMASFILSLTIHELGHFFTFLFQGVKLRALYILIFVFYKSARGWRMTVRPKLWVLLGGLVVPDIDDITDDKRYDEIIRKFAIALIAAPIVTIVYMSRLRRRGQTQSGQGQRVERPALAGQVLEESAPGEEEEEAPPEEEL